MTSLAEWVMGSRDRHHVTKKSQQTELEKAQEFLQKESNYDFAWNKNTKPDKNIMPFLRMLLDNRLIDCDTNPKDADLATRIKVQTFAYFAQHLFGLEFRYIYGLYLYGVYAIALSTDYFGMQNIDDTPSGGLENWDKKDEFLQFAKDHNRVEWLDVASTIMFTYDKERIKDLDKLMAEVRCIKGDAEKDYIAQVCQDLVKMGAIVG